MSHYGPPDGPYDAYSDRTGRIPPGEQPRPREPYEPPADPWRQGEGDQWGGGQWGGHTESQWAHDTPHPAHHWDEPPEPPPPGSRSNIVLYVAVTVLVVVVAGAVAYALYLLSGEETTPDASQRESPAVVSPSPTGEEATPDPEQTQDTTGQAASRAQEGDCLLNNGTNDEPEMQIVACDEDVDAMMYEVLARIDKPVEGDDLAAQNSSAQETCQDTDGYTHHYFEKSELLSFVLCMREKE
jgi:hypothetical protein